MTVKELLNDKKIDADRTFFRRYTRNYSLLTFFSYCSGPFWIIACHVGVGLSWFTGLGLGAWLWVIFLYLIRMLATTAVYHRLLTHKAYNTSPLFKRLGSLVAASAGQMGPSWWKAHHEEHHRFTDSENDPHSSRVGFWWSHYQWLLYPGKSTPLHLPSDIEQDVVMRLIDRFHFVPLIGLGILSYGIGGLEYLSAYFVSTTLLFHGVALVNSVCHKFGSQPFKTDDCSRNNWIAAVLTLGEGWHNFHHAFPWSARQGFTISNGELRYVTDVTFWFIRGLEFLGVASRVRLPSEEIANSNLKCISVQLAWQQYFQ